jgi:hypothetical protein
MSAWSHSSIACSFRRFKIRDGDVFRLFLALLASSIIHVEK